MSVAQNTNEPPTIEAQDTNEPNTTRTQNPSKGSSIFDKFMENIFTIFWALLIIFSFASAAVSELPIPEKCKSWILPGLGLAIFVLLAIGALIYFRKYRSVSWIMNFLILLLTVSATALIPIIFGPGEQVFLLKIGAIIFLSMLPGWLYLQFINVKGKALRVEFVANLYRLRADDVRNLPKPSPDSPYFETWQRWHASDSADHPPNLYIRKFDGLFGEDFGKNKQDSYGRFQKENFSPVFFTTLLIAIGWVTILQPELVFSRSFLPIEAIFSSLPISPGVALAYGFVGAYFFIIQMLIRRYFQDDLKTSAYINAMARIVAVILIVPILNTIWPWKEPMKYEFAFFVGFLPEIGLQALQIFVTYPLRPLLKSLEKSYPLSDLDGLNVWYESRLLEEGIEDMQNLATSNLVDVMLRTRVPVDRLVDWVDQALLYLHVQDEGEGADKSNRKNLRRFGIRTATDLQDAMHLPEDSEDIQIDFVNKLRWVLNDPDENNKPIGPSVVDAILKSLENEPNLYHVQAWRAYSDTLSHRWEQLQKQLEKAMVAS